ncbi:MAG: tetratricopeptide repeat protein [Candidatus Obscuribacterales bacterium]|nr:tetratricopeptide repeat protein [Candidatus Obscuribacterales bacterium]
MSTPQNEYLRIGLLAMLIAVIAGIAVSPSFRPEARVAPENRPGHLAPVVEPLKSGESAAVQSADQVSGDWDYIDGVKHATAGRYKEAVDCFTRAVNTNKRNSYARHKRGLAYQSLKDYKSALEDFGQAIALNPLNKDFYDSRIEVYRELKEFDKALADDARITKNLGDRCDVRQSIALTLYKSGAYEKALKALEDAAKVFPKDAYAWYLNGLCHEGLREPDKAIADYTAAIALKNDDYDAHNNRGVLYLAKEDYKKALEDFNEIVRSSKATGLTYYNRSLACDGLGKKALAEADRKKYKSLNYDPAKEQE